LQARWVRVAMHYRAERWSDVVRLLTPVVTDPALDPTYAHAVRVALGTALARLGMFAPALSYLEDPTGPVAVAQLDGTLGKALALRAQGEDLEAADVLAELYAANPEHDQVQLALSDSSYGIVPTTAARIEARSDPWDPATEPSDADFVDPGAKERKAHLLIEAEAELAEFIGLDEVKFQVARLKSSVAMSIRRQDRGLAVAQRTNHLVFAGPPGTGKTTIARVVAKIYCGLGLLKKETVREVHRADLIGQHIGETEAKTNGIIDSALDGVLFLDEAYALVSTGAKNDFGLVAIDTLLARMENDRERLVVIVAGYRADLDRFLDTNEGLRSRFTRSIDFPSYSGHELVEIATRMAEKRDSIFEQAALKDMEQLFDHLASASTPDASGVDRRSLDIAGNGRFVRNLVERAEEEREYRLDHSDSDDFTDDELMTITAEDVRNSAAPLLRGLGLSVPA
jgi:type VII secretion ATPase EccA